MNTMVETLQYRVCVYLILLHMPGKVHLYLEVVICALGQMSQLTILPLTIHQT